jgi:hypothetical protein
MKGLREGQFWRRKISGLLWMIEALNPGGTVALQRWDSPPERELMSREQFDESFELADEYEWICPACDGDVTSTHSANCNYAKGN